MEFGSIGKVGGAWRTGLWKGKASKRCGGKFSCVNSVWVCQQYDWCIDYWKVHRDMYKGIYVGSLKISSPRAEAWFLLSLFMSLAERILVVLEHDSRGYQVLFMRDFVIWPVWKFVKKWTLVRCFKFPYAIAR